MSDIHVRMGNLECRYHKDLRKYEVIHHPGGSGGYVALYIRPGKGGDDPSFETVGYRPWEARDNESVDVWAFARACAVLIQECDNEEDV